MCSSGPIYKNVHKLDKYLLKYLIVEQFRPIFRNVNCDVVFLTDSDAHIEEYFKFRKTLNVKTVDFVSLK